MQGQLDVLVSSSLVEVGIDVPNASFMIIEDAHRFGVSQLHQLRGRVGRGKWKSFCFFVSLAELSSNAKDRLQALVHHHDGFALAQEDLKIRGPGQFLGNRQSGIDSLCFANLIDDEDILIKAQQDAFELVQNDQYCSKPQNQVLAKTVYKKFVTQNRWYLTN